VIVVDTSVWIDVLGGRRTKQESLEDFVLAASLYRTARDQGVTIRNTLDCLIAAPCIRTGAPLLHADADFDRLASCSPLRIFN
jgi:predicted nucleic acid-binding protein